jgi:GNAT superfamily N-acetyltransferase
MKSEGIRFRRGNEADWPIVQGFVLSLYNQDLLETVMTPERVQGTIQELQLHPEKGQIVVFEKNEELVGYAILIFFWSNEFGGNFVEVDELFVSREYRSQGIGAAFFQWLEAEFRGKAVALGLQVAQTNDRAFEFYQRMGFDLSPDCHLWKPLKDQI